MADTLSTPIYYYQKPGHVIAAAAVLPAMDTLAVVFRFVARKKQGQDLRADDFFMIPALIFTIGIAVLIIYGVSVHALATQLVLPDSFQGDPLLLTTPQIVAVGKSQFAFVLLLPLALGCIKSSVVLFYVRIFSISKKTTLHRGLVALLCTVGAWTVAYFFANMFQCRQNIASVWGSPNELATNCPNTEDYDVSLSITNFIIDVVIMVIPIPLIWRLNMSVAKKLAAMGVFLVASVTIVASLIRMVEQIQIFKDGIAADQDPILLITTYFYWAIVECGVGVFAACLPSTSLLFRQWSPSWSTLLVRARSFFTLRSFTSGGGSQAGAGPGSAKLQGTADLEMGQKSAGGQTSWGVAGVVKLHDVGKIRVHQAVSVRTVSASEDGGTRLAAYSQECLVPTIHARAGPHDV